MEIFKNEDKKRLLEALEGLRRGIPLMDMDDRDFVASLLYRMAQIVREHGPSHGVNLNPTFSFSPDEMRIGDLVVRPKDGGMSIVNEPEENRFRRFEVGGRANGKTLYQSAFWAAVREGIDREKAKRKPQITEADIEKVIVNPPATIIYWKDGTKTVVKCSDQDIREGRLSPETGVVYAIAKKALGNKGNYNDVLRRLVKSAK